MKGAPRHILLLRELLRAPGTETGLLLFEFVLQHPDFRLRGPAIFEPLFTEKEERLVLDIACNI
jgi:hypothetical protein